MPAEYPVIGSEELEALEDLKRLLPRNIVEELQAAEAASHFGTLDRPRPDAAYEFAAAQADDAASPQQHFVVTPFNTLVEIVASQWLAQANGDLYEYPSKFYLGDAMRARLRFAYMRPNALSGDEILELSETDFRARRREAERESSRALTHEITLLSEEVRHPHCLHLDNEHNLISPDLIHVREQLSRLLPAQPSPQMHYDIISHGVIIGTLYITTAGADTSYQAEQICQLLKRASDGRNGFHMGVYNFDYSCGHVIFFRENYL